MIRAKKIIRRPQVHLICPDSQLGNSIMHFLGLNHEINLRRISYEEIELDVIEFLIFAQYVISEDNIPRILHFKQHYSDCYVLILTSRLDSEIVIKFLNKGINQVVLLNEDFKNKIQSEINIFCRNYDLQIKGNNPLIKKNNSVYTQSKLINGVLGESESMKNVFHLLNKASQSSINVLITGETGTGKELVAQTIHYLSGRSSHSLVTMNMAAIPTDLAESELFGHERGAFTGAIQQRIGKFELAGKGTIFLDEIGEISLSLQAKLLRVLQEREIVRVGGNKSIQIECRIITATNKNLLYEVKNGNFREDLYYRLYGLTIELPPLRKRDDDILILADYLINNFCDENDLTTPVLSNEAKNKLKGHSFPGNIRELKAVIERGIILSDGKTLNESDIQLEDCLSLNERLLQEKTLAEYEMEIIRYFLRKNSDNVLRTAKALGIGKSTIYRLINENGRFFERTFEDLVVTNTFLN